MVNSNEPMSWSSRVKMGTGGGGSSKPPVVPPPAAVPVASKEGTPFSQGGGPGAPASFQGKSMRGNRGSSQVGGYNLILID